MPRTGHRTTRGVVWTIAVLCALAWAPQGRAADCGPPEPAAFDKNTGEVRAQRVATLDLTCYPAKLYALEGAWTFFLLGPDALRVDGARLELGGATHTAAAVTHSSPASALIDFVYSAEQVRGPAELFLYGGGEELARYPIEVAASGSVPPASRQDGLVRVQLQQDAVLYPLHGFRNDGIVQRSVDDLGGDEGFRTLLHQLEVTGLKKIFSQYAEDDSVQWDGRYLREKIYSGAQLRQYLMYTPTGRSEAAYQEILLAFDEVEGAFLNKDQKKTSKR